MLTTPMRWKVSIYSFYKPRRKTININETYAAKECTKNTFSHFTDEAIQIG